MATPDWYRELVAVSDALAETDRAELADWHGEAGADLDGTAPADEDNVPPLTMRLASLGTAFARRSAELTPEQSGRVLRILEDVQTSGSEYDRTAVATGFLEALLNAWDKGYDLRAVWHLAGPRTRAYCRAWNEFTGIPTPDWMTE
ncbi:hypothetical protein [Streptomyces sp. WMMC940]|uniref:hypothetical protein n=1 Tax=Streptomyces sp. WMMC940 TaxID=3015153 RepID=UPI0022B6F3B7|nr:hypothetical protein [Streptomyces sp. WMMC940]MCZ7456216.1 hypothetical protein [Streptomyces sp. WMMC940]